MDKNTRPEHTLQLILELIRRTNSAADVFAESLRRERIPHLSFSQVSCAESCPQRYYLQYILGQQPHPLPEYFTKGKLFHNLLAAYYRQNENTSTQSPCPDEAFETINAHNRVHLENAYRVHLQHSWKGARVIAVEQPFAMLVDPELPPFVGVIDLVLEQEGNFIVVDHKTGRNFYPQDELQGTIYIEYMRREFAGAQTTFYYDHYRWVENLQRIRKPALQRTPIASSPEAWPAALERIRQAYRLIEQINAGRLGMRNGECFRCPYRGMCWQD